MASIDYIKDDIVINGTSTTTVVDALRKASLADTHIIEIIGNWFVGATGSPTPNAFRFTTDVQSNDPTCASSYGRSFAHTDWIDGESRVQAGMTPEELGFNVRFHAIENEFDAVADQLDQLSRCTLELRADLVGVVGELQSKITSMQNDIHGLQQDRDDQEGAGPAILGTIDVGGISKFVTKFGSDFKFVSIDTDPIVTNPDVIGPRVFEPELVSPDRMRFLVDEIDHAMDAPAISRLFESGQPVTVGVLRRNASDVTLPSGVTLGSLLANADAGTRFDTPGDAVAGIVGVIAEDLPPETVTELRRDVFEDAAVERTGSAVLNSNVGGAVAGAAAFNDALNGAGVTRIGDVVGNRPSALVERVVVGNAAIDRTAVRNAINNAVVAGAIRNLGLPSVSRVAISGDVVATPGTTFPYSANGATVADSGTWQAGSISYDTYPALHVGGSRVIWKASCTFALTGKLGNSAASATETVTLEANPHPLQAQADSVLVHGDSQVSTTSGNKLEVIASTTLAITT